MDKIYQKIDKYLESDKNTPIIIDVCELGQLTEIRCHYAIGVHFISASDYCSDDSFPRLDALLNDISTRKETVFLTELSTFLKLKGKEELKQRLRQMLDLSIEGKLIILTFQCKDLLRFPDPRLYAASRIIFIEGEPSPTPIITLIGEDVNMPTDYIISGIKHLPSIIEDETNSCSYLRTSLKKGDIQSSILPFNFITTAYEALIYSYPKLTGFEEHIGTKEQWEILLKELNKEDSWESYLSHKFNTDGTFIDKISKLSSFDSFTQWVYFLALKYYGVGDNKYLARVLNESSTIEDFIKNLYCYILVFDYNQIDFKDYYSLRKQCLQSQDFVAELSSFCKQVESKGLPGIYYLTDNTKIEKELVIKLITQHHEELGQDGVFKILKSIYPDLYTYMQPYSTGIDLLDTYIPLYKYSKLTNKILPQLESIVNEQAQKREYNQVLKARSFYLSHINYEDVALFFVDALSVEFLNYLDTISAEKGLKMKVNVGRCDLPSITSVNKYFVDDFKNAGCPVYDIKDLDEVKHSGNKEYNFENTKLPIHIIKELSILDDVLYSIQAQLTNGKVQKIYVVSDHGASRLVVLHNCENKIEVKEKGLHSGRCCPISDTDEKPLNATEENDFWCLANYDLFKGGRKTGVEVHGGATLEEVAVPIIEFSLRGKEIEAYILQEYKTIFVSYKKKAFIKLYVDTLSSDVSVLCNGKSYSCMPTNNKREYQVELTDITRKGQYTLDVKVNGSLAVKDLEFEVKKEGASERNYF